MSGFKVELNDEQKAVWVELSKEEQEIILSGTSIEFMKLFWDKSNKIFERRRKETIYLEHKTAGYKNNKRKLGFYFDGHITELIPYKVVQSNGVSFGFNWGVPKEIDEETMLKHYKKITQSDYFYKESTHLPI